MGEPVERVMQLRYRAVADVTGFRPLPDFDRMAGEFVQQGPAVRKVRGGRVAGNPAGQLTVRAEDVVEALGDGG